MFSYGVVLGFGIKNKLNCWNDGLFQAENKKKNRYPDKLPYDHNRVILNAVLNASNSDYINASTVVCLIYISFS